MREISPRYIQTLPEVPEVEYFSPPESEMTHLRTYWKMVVKHRYLVVLVFLLVVGLGAAQTFSLAPLYTASAMLKIEPQNSVVQVRENSTADADPLSYFQTQCALLKSRPLAARIITELELKSNSAFTTAKPTLFDRVLSWPLDYVDSVLTYVSDLLLPATEQPSTSPSIEEFEFGVHPGLIGRYLSLLTVTPVKDTQLVQITFTTPDPRLSQKLANAHAAAFIRTTLETRFELTKEAREFLEQKRAEFQAKVQQAEETLQRFREQYGVVSLEGSENIVVDRMKDLNQRLTEARVKRIELESLYRTVENKDSRYLSEIIENTVIQQMRTSLLALEAEQARLATTFTPDHPRMVELSEQIKEARRRLDREIGNIVRKIESDYGAARAREETLQAEVERQEQEALNLKKVEVEYSILKAEVDSARTLHGSVLKQLNETTPSNNAAISNIQISERADLPLFPSSPQVGRNLQLAAACGLCLGIGLAVFLEYMDSRVGTPEAVWHATAIPTLGIVPHMKVLPRWAYGYRGALKGSSLNGLTHPWTAAGHSFTQDLIVAHHPLSIISESYRTIRTMLLLAAAEKPPQVILLTSAHPGEGKTVTTINLAITLAQSGSTVVVIDTDLRNGRCHTLLGNHNRYGLSQILTGISTLEESVQETPVAGLSFLSRGALVPNPADLLGSQRMREVVRNLQERFDFVLLDSAPALVVSDALVLSQLCDGVLLVLHGRKTTEETARRVVEHLGAVRARILGVVLNAVDIRDSAYADYRSYYSSYAAVQKETGQHS
jgi:succinoglycan biosynthesis transport protein ExoP